MSHPTLPLRYLPIGSIWMAADGGSYGCIVVGHRPETEDALVRHFSENGWADGPEDIDWLKLQYRYYPVWMKR